jgi:hypothetical protein
MTREKSTYCDYVVKALSLAKDRNKYSIDCKDGKLFIKSKYIFIKDKDEK